MTLWRRPLDRQRYLVCNPYLLGTRLIGNSIGPSGACQQKPTMENTRAVIAPGGIVLRTWAMFGRVFLAPSGPRLRLQFHLVRTRFLETNFRTFWISLRNLCALSALTESVSMQTGCFWIISASPRMCGAHAPEKVHPVDFIEFKAARDRAVSDGLAFETEARLRRHDGAYRWHLVRYNPVHDDEGKLLRWYIACTDIDSRKQSEFYLLEAQRLARIGSWAFSAGGFEYWLRSRSLFTAYSRVRARQPFRNIWRSSIPTIESSSPRQYTRCLREFRVRFFQTDFRT